MPCVFQPASSEAACEPGESCLGDKEPSGGPWYLWFCMSLFLATILLCVALCCLQRWLTRCRRFSSQRTVAVFALSDVDSVYENDVAPPPRDATDQGPPPAQSLERSSSCVRSDMAGNGPPPPYEEMVKHVSGTWPVGPLRVVAPAERQLRRGPAEEGELGEA